MTQPLPHLHQASARALLCAALLLSATSCVHKKAVIFDHNTGPGKETITYRGKPITFQELYDLGENAEEDQIDLIVKQDGQTQKLDLKTWHTGMKLLPDVILRMPGDLVD
ncbi:hypothetical protein [Prosthecobacter sp.]|uniref:hypothetical protein n=1 Tax=Prosthecobacter sp. TaxID=1965333 RepID=UPI003784F92E